MNPQSPESIVSFPPASSGLDLPSRLVGWQGKSSSKTFVSSSLLVCKLRLGDSANCLDRPYSLPSRRSALSDGPLQMTLWPTMPNAVCMGSWPQSVPESATSSSANGAFQNYSTFVTEAKHGLVYGRGSFGKAPVSLPNPSTVTRGNPPRIMVTGSSVTKPGSSSVPAGATNFDIRNTFFKQLLFKGFRDAH